MEVDTKELRKIFDYLANKSIDLIHQSLRMGIAFYEKDIKTDWQLQGTCIFLLLFIFLMILVNLQWNKYGPAITGIELAKSYSSFDHVDSFADTVPEFPDEDPLTFTKKKNQ